MVGDALLDIIFAPEENDGVGMLIGMYAIWLHEKVIANTSLIGTDTMFMWLASFS